MKHYEEKEQRAVIQWSELARIPGTNSKVRDYIFAIPNGGLRNKREAARLKRQGVTPGVSDLFLAYPCGSIHGFWIEMKKQRKDFSTPAMVHCAVTDLQKQWLQRMEDVNYMTAVCYGAHEAIEAIQTYLGMPQ